MTVLAGRDGPMRYHLEDKARGIHDTEVESASPRARRAVFHDEHQVSTRRCRDARVCRA